MDVGKGERASVRRSGEARAEARVAVANTGVIQGDLVLPAPRASAASGYLHQVRRLAATDFRGRERELAAMADFCTAPDPPSARPESAWWRWLAPAWAGKSALLAQFVLHPPPATTVVAFFITARLAGQSTRAAFCEVVQRQLYALLDEEEPPVSEHTRDEQFLHALDRAAALCADRGERLVLVVDGLDEDRSRDRDVARDGTGHSIAALLPAASEHGMRILVAGRPHPPVPSDVPRDHPLNGSRIDHALDNSPFAQARREEVEQALEQLFDPPTTGQGPGPQTAQRGLVAWVAAAGGGLSASDLAELSGMRPPVVKRALRESAGRLLRTALPSWGTGQEGPVYLLAHEEIHGEALNWLSGRELNDLRDALHHWADRYRQAGWPAGTPEYLLRGYPQLLQQDGDLDRLAALARDPARHACLWHVSGADRQALEEIAASFDLLTARAEADDSHVELAVHLAMERDALLELSGNVPEDLIRAWARLGQVDRAAALARAHGEPFERAMRMIAVVEALPQGDRSAAAALLAEARGWAEAVADEADLAEFLFALAGAGTRMERPEFADAAVRTLMDLLELWAYQEDRAEVLGELAWMLGQAGARASAADLAAEAADLIREGEVSERRPEILAAVIKGLAASGSADAALALLDDTFGRPESRTSGSPGVSWAEMAEALALGGRHQRAGELARGIREEAFRVRALTSVAEQVMKAEMPEQAAALAEEAASLILTHRTIHEGDESLQRLLRVLAEAGHHERAEAVARATTKWPEHTACSAVMAAALVSAGEEARAIEIACAEETPGRRAIELAAVARALAESDQHDRAARLARTTAELTRVAAPSPRHQDRVGRQATKALAYEGHFDLALTLAGAEPRSAPWDDAWELLGTGLARAGQADRAEALARTITGPAQRAGVLAAVAERRVDEGAYEEALALVRTLADPRGEAEVLHTICERLLASGQRQEALDAARRCAELADPARDAIRLAISALARCGEYDEAAQLLGTIYHGGLRIDVQTELARIRSLAGDHDQALALAVETRHRIGYWPEVERASQLAVLAGVHAAAGDFDEAVACAEELDRYRRPDALAVVLRQIAERGAFGHVERALRRAIPDAAAGKLEATIGEAVAQFVAAGEHQRLVDLAESLPLEHVAGTLLVVARRLLAAGHGAEAARLAERAAACTPPDWGPAERAEALTPVAALYAELGRPAEAARYVEHIAELTRSFDDPDDRFDQMAELVPVLARVGRVDQAVELTRSIGDLGTRDEALASMVEALADTGQLLLAATLARTITDAEERAEALAELGVRTARDGDPGAGRLLLIEALAAADWTDRLNELGKLAPEALARSVQRLAAPTDIPGPHP